MLTGPAPSASLHACETLDELADHTRWPDGPKALWSEDLATHGWLSGIVLDSEVCGRRVPTGMQNHGISLRRVPMWRVISALARELGRIHACLVPLGPARVIDK